MSVAHASFWFLSATGSIIAYLLSNTQADPGASRYLLTVWLAIGGLLGLLATGTAVRRGTVGAGAALFVACGTFTLVREADDEPARLVTKDEINQLARFADSRGVRHGLTGYWDANNVTWATRLKLRLLAVSECNQAFRFCPYAVHQITTSYQPRPEERSMLVVDARQPMVTGPDPRHGRPLKVAHIGELTVYVYGYDIRTRITRLVT